MDIRPVRSKPAQRFIHRLQSATFPASTFPRVRPSIIGNLGRAYGIDLAWYEWSFDPDLAQPGLIDFAFQKVTQGINIVDQRLNEIYEGVRKVAVRGGYHYITNDDPIRQANHFLNYAGNKSYHFHIGDLEKYGNTFTDTLISNAYIFLDELSMRRPDVKVVLYTNPDTYDTWIYPAAMRIWGYDPFIRWPLWIAQYYFTVNPDGNPAMPKYRKDWKFWQISDQGDPDVHGTGGWGDRNVFNGSLQQLLDYAGAGSTDPQPPVTIPVKGVVNAKLGLLLRDAPVTGNVLGSLAYGTNIEGDLDISTDWIHGTFRVQSGYQITGYISNAYILPPLTPLPIVDKKYEGVTTVRGRVYGSDYVLRKFDTLLASVRVVHIPGALSKTSKIVKDLGATFGYNGNDWPDGGPYYPNNYAVSMGNVLVPWKARVPYIDFKKGGGCEIRDNNTPGYNVASGFRFLVRDGINLVPAPGTSTEAKYTERHARTVFGMDSEGRFMAAVCKGSRPEESGWLLWECAQVFIANGAVTVFDMDSGSSSREVEGSYVFDGFDDGIENEVVQHVIIYADEDGGTTMPIMKKGTAFGKGNIKDMNTSDILAVMGAGDVVYGELSPLGTDLINFDHFYDNGVRFELETLCKVSVINMNLTDEAEPGTPDPTPPPTGEPLPDLIEGTEIFKDVAGNVIAEYSVVKMRIK